MGRRGKDAVQIDKYALENAMLANETSAQEVSLMLGHAKNYMAQVVARGGYINRRDYDNLKGLLRVTDTDIIKAVPIQRSDAVESIYQPTPVAKNKSRTVVLTEDVENIINALVRICEVNKTELVNGIVSAYVDGNETIKELLSAINAVKALTI